MRGGDWFRGASEEEGREWDDVGEREFLVGVGGNKDMGHRETVHQFEKQGRARSRTGLETRMKLRRKTCKQFTRL